MRGCSSARTTGGAHSDRKNRTRKGLIVIAPRAGAKVTPVGNSARRSRPQSMRRASRQQPHQRNLGGSRRFPAVHLILYRGVARLDLALLTRAHETTAARPRVWAVPRLHALLWFGAHPLRGRHALNGPWPRYLLESRSRRASGPVRGATITGRNGAR